MKHGHHQTPKSRKGINKRRRLSIIVLSLILAVGIGVAVWLVWQKGLAGTSPETLLKQYLGYIQTKDYEKMYAQLSPDSAKTIKKADFVTRNKNIYEGIEATDLQVSAIKETSRSGGQVKLSYQVTMDSLAGPIKFKNTATMVHTSDGYRLQWQDSLIFPGLKSTDKVKISSDDAQRGSILDRNGSTLAGQGVASAVGVVPGKLTDKNAAVTQLAALLGIDAQTINAKLSAGWVKDDSFVPLKTIKKLNELELMEDQVDDAVKQEKELEDKLLAIPGVMISDTAARTYPLGKAAAHLIGYMQNVTAEDLKKHAGEGYTGNDQIGKSGLESLYEKDLKGRDGHEIYIETTDGEHKETLAAVTKQDGKDIQLTIDSKLQQLLYQQFAADKSASVALNPYTGEVLALLSTPSFDNNDFILGLSADEWKTLNDDPKQPMYNRFRQTFSPGSSFKPVVAAIGLKTGTVNPNEDFGQSGLKWQKDQSWGSYYVTTLHEYAPATMENALIYSDNIYFAKAALKIGKEKFQQSLNDLGFNQELPFAITMKKSQYANAGDIATEVQLADSGYGQGEVLVNPLHLASLYTAFSNGGNILKPQLLYKEGMTAENWLPGAFSQDNVNTVLNGLKKVVNDSHGTGYAAHRSDIVLAGKTGTAEIKATKEDTDGTELGWFSVFTTDPNSKTPVLITSMVQDVKDIGGSGYVVKKDKAVLDTYLQ